MAENLVEYLKNSAERWPDRTAVVDPSGSSLTFSQLWQQVDALARFLAAQGVGHGDRVGVALPKTMASVTALFAIMQAGAAYVPIDFTTPAERGKRILTDCNVRVVFVDPRASGVLPDGATGILASGAEESPIKRSGLVVQDPISFVVQDPISFEQAIATAGPAIEARAGRDDLAYILYTSGSTGVPKGVMLSHENALSFVDWCSTVFHPTEEDRFSSHAPFHFDLSVLDVYVSIKHGAELHLISEELGKNPKELARFVADRRLTIWYSTPSILTLLLQFGGLDAYDSSSLRIVLFAGEVFPVKHLRELQRHWPLPDYYNLYGPTETNVCTFARVPRVPDDRDHPYPIGFLCGHCDGVVLDDEGREVAEGGEGLLYIAGSSVFEGYWNRPVENAAAFLDRQGTRWYNTGDLVRWNPAEGYTYSGRKDRMVKRRGFRIELGEIERALYRDSRVSQAAVISVPDPDTGVRIVAFLGCPADGPTIVELKTFCAKHLPAYMSPDRFVVKNELPRTSTDKVDYQTLKRSLAEAEPATPLPATAEAGG